MAVWRSWSMRERIPFWRIIQTDVHSKLFNRAIASSFARQRSSKRYRLTCRFQSISYVMRERDSEAANFNLGSFHVPGPGSFPHSPSVRCWKISYSLAQRPELNISDSFVSMHEISRNYTESCYTYLQTYTVVIKNICINYYFPTKQFSIKFYYTFHFHRLKLL